RHQAMVWAVPGGAGSLRTGTASSRVCGEPGCAFPRLDWNGQRAGKSPLTDGIRTAGKVQRETADEALWRMARRTCGFDAVRTRGAPGGRMESGTGGCGEACASQSGEGPEFRLDARLAFQTTTPAG